MSDLLLQEVEAGIVTLTLNQPALRNPISDQPTIDALVAAIEQADRDITVRAVILTGAGAAFSTGGNIQTMRNGGGLNDALAAQTRRNYRNGIQRLPLLFESIEVPVIAADQWPGDRRRLRPRLHVRHPHRRARARSSPRASSSSASFLATAVLGCCRAWSAFPRRARWR